MKQLQFSGALLLHLVILEFFHACWIQVELVVDVGLRSLVFPAGNHTCWTYTRGLQLFLTLPKAARLRRSQPALVASLVTRVIRVLRPGVELWIVTHVADAAVQPLKLLSKLGLGALKS